MSRHLADDDSLSTAGVTQRTPRSLGLWLSRSLHNNPRTRLRALTVGRREGLRRALHDIAARLRFRRPDDEEYVRALYERLLRREPDEVGLRNHVSRLHRGLSRDELVVDIVTSHEFSSNVATTRAACPIRVVEGTYGGIPLSVCIADEIAAEWYENGWPDLPELTFLGAHRLRRGASVLDLGAHQGVYAMTLASYVGPDGRVVAVDANLGNVGLIEINKRLNHIGTVTAVHAAVAERSGLIGFGRGGNGQIDESGTYRDTTTVPAVTIDELAERFSPPDVVVLDVEGYECKVLQGAPETLAREVDWHIEAHVGAGLEEFGGSVETILSFFPESRFDRYVSNEIVRQPRPATAALLDRMSRDRLYLTAIAR